MVKLVAELDCDDKQFEDFLDYELDHLFISFSDNENNDMNEFKEELKKIAKLEFDLLQEMN